MKKVKILTGMAGEGFVWNPGDVVEMTAAEVKRLVAAGYAVEVKGKSGTEGE